MEHADRRLAGRFVRLLGAALACYRRPGENPRVLDLRVSARRPAFLAALACTVLCGACNDEPSTSGTTEGRAQPVIVTPESKRDELVLADLEVFRPGRSRNAILEALGGRAGIVWMAECDGRAVCSIRYQLLPVGPRDDRLGPSLEAIFVDGDFVRFVQRPPEGPWPEFTGDCAPLKWALEAPPASPAVLRQAAISAKAPPQHVDWGLTIAVLPIALLMKLQEPKGPTAGDYERNDVLRTRFDAARLDLGMSSAEVSAALDATPLERGNVSRGEFELYGSRESLPVPAELHFTNVLVVYDADGKACVVNTADAVDECIESLAEESADERHTPDANDNREQRAVEDAIRRMLDR